MKTMLVICPQSPVMLATRLLSSPALYFLKNAAVSESIRIIVAASTCKLSFSPIFAASRPFIDVKRSLLTVAQTRNTEVPIRIDQFPDPRASENSILLIVGNSMPVPVINAIASRRSTISDPPICFVMYFIRLPTDIFSSGNGL